MRGVSKLAADQNETDFIAAIGLVTEELRQIIRVV
jgi:hypothetical protein